MTTHKSGDRLAILSRLALRETIGADGYDRAEAIAHGARSICRCGDAIQLSRSYFAPSAGIAFWCGACPRCRTAFYKAEAIS